MKTKLTSKAQITIPKAVRQQLNLKAGDIVSFEEERPGKWVFNKACPSNLACGIGNQFAKKRHISVEDMNGAIAAEVARQHRDSSKR